MVTWLDLPAVESADDPVWGWAYRACQRITALDCRARFGDDDLAIAPEVFAAEQRASGDVDPYLTIGLDGPAGLVESGVCVGWSTHERTANQDKAEIVVIVRPDWADSAVGDDLLARFEDIARRAGRTAAVFSADYAPGEDRAPYLTTAAGDAAPAEAWPIALALRHGYELGQAERRSRLDLPMDQASYDRLAAEAAPAGDRYRLHLWHGGIPLTWRQGYADLRAVFITQALTGAIDWQDEVWDVERVGRWERTKLESGNVPLIAVAEDPASGRLVGVSGLTYRRDGQPFAEQGVTLVLPGHRGHRLGLWLKLATYDALRATAPQAERIYTVNAQENRPMLAINLAMGFRPYGGSGTMYKAL